MNLLPDIEYMANQMRKAMRFSPEDPICLKLPDGVTLTEDEISFLKAKKIFLEVDETSPDYQ